MLKSRILGISIMAALLLSACNRNNGGSALNYDYYVNAAVGNDYLNDGSQDNPFKTITHALGIANGDMNISIKVNPGTYDVVNGETFPIEVPTGVSLIGDEENRGNGSETTMIRGGGEYPTYDANYISTTMYMREGSKISGFILEDNSTVASFHMPFVLKYDDDITIHRNTIINGDHAIYFAGSDFDVITDNNITKNRNGISVIASTPNTRIENNIITHNRGTGVYTEVNGVDFGGGAAGSAGGNIFSCNSGNDLMSYISFSGLVFAENNMWDHTPPTETITNESGGIDVYNMHDVSTIEISGYTLAPSPCN
ncbi:DUF1565 domain-containing protein [Sulfurovum mangrovi]|uniref:DUF1565 domain-containing protein n=1 Tax=Sulfurovum mangrovi TaxID=2893889 RepID=UPI001E4438CB|nr:DUF1565 domain-containing protein [Sulfurovum mangrovi]UFH58713.1 DUF1565 domain-containing protein [Sulfurovum mangrovi]